MFFEGIETRENQFFLAPKHHHPGAERTSQRVKALDIFFGGWLGSTPGWLQFVFDVRLLG